MCFRNTTKSIEKNKGSKDVDIKSIMTDEHFEIYSKQRFGKSGLKLSPTHKTWKSV